MTFTTTKGHNHTVLVTGTDAFGQSGSVILDSTIWDTAREQQAFQVASEEFDKTVEEFFAPIAAAGEAFKAKLSEPEIDPIRYITLQEPVEGQAPKIGAVIALDNDAVILRLIEEGKTDRLRWINNGTEIFIGNATTPTTPAAVAAFDEAGTTLA